MIKLKRKNEQLIIQGQDTDSMGKNIFIFACTVGFLFGLIVCIMTRSVLFAFLFGPVIALVMDGGIRIGFYLERGFVANHYDRTLTWNHTFGIKSTRKTFDDIIAIQLDTFTKEKHLGIIPLNTRTMHRIRVIDRDNNEILVAETIDGKQARQAAQKLTWMLEKPVKDEMKEN